ncbi:MAG: thiol reductant ABC exporter subunit CydD [Terracoccus sp.]
MKPFDPRLLRAVPAARRPVAALGALGIASGAVTIGTAFALSALVVAVVDGSGLRIPLVWLTALFVARALLAGAGEMVSAWAGVSVSTALRSALLRRWGRLDADARPESGTAVTLATGGVTSIEPYAARFLPTLVTAAVVPALAVLTLLVVDWRSALVVVLTLPLLPLFAALIGSATAESTQRRWSALASLSGHFLDVVRGLPTLVSYGRAGRQTETIRDVSDRHRRATMETLRIAFLSSAALELLATISVAIVAVTVGLRLAGGGMALGPALVAILLAPEAYWPIRRVGAEYHAAADGAVALDALLVQLTDPGPESVSESESAPEQVRVRPSCNRPRRRRVVARDLGYRYPGSSVDVVSDLDLDLGPGLTVVTGPSGVGKSTLLDLLAGLRRPTAGTVSAPDVHYLTQRPFLVGGPIRDSLTLAHPASDARLWDALRAVGVDGVVASLDHGLSATLGDDGFGVSAGQRQRLALARAVLAPEPVLLLDEPTAHLDTEAAEQVNALIVELARHRVVVAVTHRPELVRSAHTHVHLTRRGTGRGTGTEAGTSPSERRFEPAHRDPAGGRP